MDVTNHVTTVLHPEHLTRPFMALEVNEDVITGLHGFRSPIDLAQLRFGLAGGSGGIVYKVMVSS